MKYLIQLYLINLILVIIVMVVLLNNADADEVGLRLGSAISPLDNSLIQFPSGGDGSGGLTDYEGKNVTILYDWEPHRNFYMEGAVGYRSPSDVFEYSSMDYELSPGLKVDAGSLVVKLSEGLAYMPQNQFDFVAQTGYKQIDFVTHFTVGLKDPQTGIGIYLDRSHYSNGNALNNPSLNYAGFMIQFPLGKK